jgi:hypothetical protein
MLFLPGASPLTSLDGQLVEVPTNLAFVRTDDPYALAQKTFYLVRLSLTHSLLLTLSLTLSFLPRLKLTDRPLLLFFDSVPSRRQDRSRSRLDDGLRPRCSSPCSCAGSWSCSGSSGGRTSGGRPSPIPGLCQEKLLSSDGERGQRHLPPSPLSLSTDSSSLSPSFSSLSPSFFSFSPSFSLAYSSLAHSFFDCSPRPTLPDRGHLRWIPQQVDRDVSDASFLVSDSSSPLILPLFLFLFLVFSTDDDLATDAPGSEAIDGSGNFGARWGGRADRRNEGEEEGSRRQGSLAGLVEAMSSTSPSFLPLFH